MCVIVVYGKYLVMLSGMVQGQYRPLIFTDPLQEMQIYRHRLSVSLFDDPMNNQLSHRFL
jgi:hypothetical protein